MIKLLHHNGISHEMEPECGAEDGTFSLVD